MWRYHSAWSRLTAIGHVIGGVTALIATAIAWGQLGRTATHLATTTQPAASDAAATFPPQILIVIPARNEAALIAGCLASLAAQRLASVGIWVVDDGSTDATAAIVQGLAAQDPRIHLVAGAACPPGWAGKNWALHQGIGAALVAHPALFNQWLLLTDADTWHHPDLLQRAYDQAIAASLHLVSVLPRVAERPWGAAALRGAIGEFYSFYYGLDLPINGHGATTSAVMAQGQFMLVHRVWYQAIGGFAHPLLRAALDDDRMLAYLIKRAGGRVGMLTLPELLATVGYPSLRAAWQGHLHHVAPTLTTPRQARHALQALFLVDVATLLPALGMLHAVQLGFMHGWRRRRLALIRWALQLGAITLVRRRAARMSHLSRWYPVMAPWGSVLLQGLIIQVLWRQVTGTSHIVWKGRRYP